MFSGKVKPCKQYCHYRSLLKNITSFKDFIYIQNWQLLNKNILFWLGIGLYLQQNLKISQLANSISNTLVIHTEYYTCLFGILHFVVIFEVFCSFVYLLFP